MSIKKTTSDGKYFTVQGLKEYLQTQEQYFEFFLDCPYYRMSKEVTSLLAVYDGLTPEEITTRFFQLKIAQPQKPKASKVRRESICWRHLWNKLKFWNIRTSKKSEKK
ncbi:hypothetical protein GCK72_004419 [Caenorhabditis remanei]|uniref:Uncharacterized protein n=1 Tax=Caenorhabditis remanei TaxID=31234 RepID=E3N1A7_CAERE|nr:hypothetical protein GCK72_004419 [Caenorhabditis remanei]EFO83297.1 hypothetical protein CRE_13617 [Caenorhabditis remanei]KAF1764471.1 hypothetical protein GCK72_004419 [Caenorhabditis remanei]